MAETRRGQASVLRADHSAGGFDPLMLHRTDIQKRYRCVARAWNMVCLLQGPLRSVSYAYVNQLNVESLSGGGGVGAPEFVSYQATLDVAGVPNLFVMITGEDVSDDDRANPAFTKYIPSEGFYQGYDTSRRDATLTPSAPRPTSDIDRSAVSISVIENPDNPEQVYLFSPLTIPNVFSPQPADARPGRVPFPLPLSLFSNDGTDPLQEVQILEIGGSLNADSVITLTLDGIATADIPLTGFGATDDAQGFIDEVRARLEELPVIGAGFVLVSETTVGEKFSATDFTTQSDAINRFYNDSSGNASYPGARLTQRTFSITLTERRYWDRIGYQLVQDNNPAKGASFRITRGAQSRSPAEPPIWNADSYNLPAVAELFAGRLWCAEGQFGRRGWLYASEVENYTNFKHDRVATDNSPISVEFQSNVPPLIYHILASRNLFIFTDRGIWVLETQGAITPSTIAFRKITEIVCNGNIKPVEVSNRIFFLEQGAPALRMIEYDEAISSYEARLVSDTFSHLLDGRINGMSVLPSGGKRPTNYIVLSRTAPDSTRSDSVMIMVEPENDFFAPSEISFGGDEAIDAFCAGLCQTIASREGITYLRYFDYVDSVAIAVDLVDIGIDGPLDRVIGVDDWTEFPLDGDSQRDEALRDFRCYVELAPLAIQQEERESIAGVQYKIDRFFLLFADTTELFWAIRRDDGTVRLFDENLMHRTEAYTNERPGPYSGRLKMEAFDTMGADARLIFGVKSPNATFTYLGAEIVVSWHGS